MVKCKKILIISTCMLEKGLLVMIQIDQQMGREISILHRMLLVDRLSCRVAPLSLPGKWWSKLILSAILLFCDYLSMCIKYYELEILRLMQDLFSRSLFLSWDIGGISPWMTNLLSKTGSSQILRASQGHERVENSFLNTAWMCRHLIEPILVWAVLSSKCTIVEVPFFGSSNCFLTESIARVKTA